MVPPGANYEFFEAPSFKARTKDLPELVALIEAHVRKHFDRLKRLDPNTKIGEMIFEGCRFGFVVIGLGNSRLSLQQIWNADTEELNKGLLEAAQKARRKP